MSDHGSNVTKLITKFVSVNAVPKGGGIADGMKFFSDVEYRKRILDQSEKDAVKAIELILAAPDNPYADDVEAIAKMLVEKIEEAEEQRKPIYLRKQF